MKSIVSDQMGGKRRKKKMEKWRKSIIFNQTRGGWRRWLPHTWHCCRTEAPGQLHPNIVIVVIIIVVIVITIVNVILISKSMEIASGVVLF